MVPRVLSVSRVNSNIDISILQTNNSVVIIDNTERVNVRTTQMSIFLPCVSVIRALFPFDVNL